jgi:hypothetical protein
MHIRSVGESCGVGFDFLRPLGSPHRATIGVSWGVGSDESDEQVEGTGGPSERKVL